MCSVNFIYSQNTNKKILENSIEQMVNTSKHRGPDATETVTMQDVAFGFNRLEIVGGKLGSQPIYDKENNIVLICNGEIFNYQDLIKRHFAKKELLTTSDVEVIIHLYIKFGDKFPNYLEGQFGFVLYDFNKGKILMGRDRFGINPLFYSFDKKTLLVASEIKSLLASRLLPNVQLDQKGLVESLLFYGAVPPRTCFRNIFQVPPSSYVVYHIKENTIQTYRYWRIKKTTNKLTDRQEAIRKLRLYLTTSIKKRLQGRSTPGIYLSGGLDSSLVASITAKYSQTPVKLLSIAFKDKEFDESNYQTLVATHLHASHHKVELSDKEIIDTMKKCIFHIETPLIRTAPIPMYALSKLAKKERTKFVLCGEGADEIFAGYPVFSKGVSSFENKSAVINPFLSIFKDPGLISHAAKTRATLLRNNKEEDVLTNSRKKEINTKLSQYLLVNQGDRMSMANGVEQRFPFLDKKLVNFAFSLDENLLVDEATGKKILREAFKDYLPQSLIQRKKQGYLAPDNVIVRKLMNAKEYKYLIEEKYFDKVGIFDYEKVINLVNNIKAESHIKEFTANAVLFVITTHMLYETFIDSFNPQKTNVPT